MGSCTDPIGALDIVARLRAISRYEHDDLSVGDEAADEIERLHADAARYRWLRAQKGLRLESDAMLWTRIDGTKFVSTHLLAAGGTQYGPHETLDIAIDAAMKDKP